MSKLPLASTQACSPIQLLLAMKSEQKGTSNILDPANHSHLMASTSAPFPPLAPLVSSSPSPATGCSNHLTLAPTLTPQEPQSPSYLLLIHSGTPSISPYLT